MAEPQTKLDESPVNASGSDGSSSRITKFMMLLAFVFAVVAAAASNSSTLSATPVFDSGVPTNAPIPGDYTGALRPQIHFSPPRNFMNDPNGCHRDANGTYHLYYQCESNTTSPYLDLLSLHEELMPFKHESWPKNALACHRRLLSSILDISMYPMY